MTPGLPEEHKLRGVRYTLALRHSPRREWQISLYWPDAPEPQLTYAGTEWEAHERAQREIDEWWHMRRQSLRRYTG